MPAAVFEGLERAFPAGARIRGESYFRQGRVLLRRLDERAIAAEVRGTTRYDVSLRSEDDTRTWRAACTCEAYANWGPCKHIWATILAARAAWGSETVPDDAAVRDAPERWSASRRTDPSRDAKERLPSRTEDLGHARGAEVDRADREEHGPLRRVHSDPDASSPSDRRREREPWDVPLSELRALASRPRTPAAVPGAPERRLRYLLAVQRRPGGVEAFIRVLTQHAYKRGGWSEPKPFRVRGRGDSTELAAEDRAVLALLTGASGQGLWTYGDASDFALPSPLQPLFLARVAATGRLHLSLDGILHPAALSWDPGPPWQLGIELSRRACGGLTLGGFLSRGAARMSLAEPVVVLPGGVVVTERQVGEADWRGAWECAAILRRSRRIEVPAQGVRELLELIVRFPGEAILEAPGILREVEGSPRPRLLLDAPEIDGTRCASVRGAGARNSAVEIGGRVEFEYGSERVRRGEPTCLRAEGDMLVRLRRDERAERAAIERLAALGARIEPASGPFRPASAADRDVTVPSHDLSDLVSALLAEGWHVEAAGRPLRSGGTLKLSIRSGIDWFDLAAAADFGGAGAALPDLLRAVQRGVRTVRLSDGSLGILPAQWLAGWGLAAVGTEHRGALRFHRSQAWILDVLLAERAEVDVDATFARARSALRRFERFEPAREPEGFRGELRPYQRDGLGWLALLCDLGLGGCLADDMGLGKTVQVLALLAGRKASDARPSLVVAPRSVVFNWLREAERFAPDLSVLAHHGPERSKKERVIARHDLVVTTYGTLRRDAELLSRIPFAHAILDEAQAIKNASSQSAKAARLLRADHRLVLTGTPVENHLDDLWSLFEFLNPGMLGRSNAFRDVVAPARTRGRAGASVDAARSEENMGRESARVLARALRPFLLRRTKEQVLKELPPKIEQVVACDLEGEERRRYEELRDHYRAALLARAEEQGMQRIRMHVLEALLRLRQAACHPGLIDRARTGEGSAKLDALLPMLEEVRESGHKALVFSQFTSFLAIVRDRLDAAGVPYEYLDGRTRKREERVKRFQEDTECPLFLISLKAGGFGLNLAAADYVFLLDPWWNPAVERQAIDRAHRIGQTRVVNSYRLVARDTIEEKVLELQERKRGLADAILGEAEGTLRELTREDLEKLLS